MNWFCRNNCTGNAPKNRKNVGPKLKSIEKSSGHIGLRPKKRGFEVPVCSIRSLYLRRPLFRICGSRSIDAWASATVRR